MKKENSATVAMEDGKTIFPSRETLEKNKSSKRSKIKAKIIKNLVLNKLRSSKYCKSKFKEDFVNMLETCSEVSSYYEVEEQEEQGFESIKGSFCHDGISSLDGTELALVSDFWWINNSMYTEVNGKVCLSSSLSSWLLFIFFNKK